MQKCLSRSSSYPSKLLDEILCREEAVAAIKDGETQLATLRRQVVLGKMYPSAKSVME